MCNQRAELSDEILCQPLDCFLRIKSVTEAPRGLELAIDRPQIDLQQVGPQPLWAARLTTIFAFHLEQANFTSEG